MTSIYEKIGAKKHRAAFGEQVKTKRDEIKKITQNKSTQTELFKEFLTNESKEPEYIKSSAILLEVKEREKLFGKIDEKLEIMNNIKGFTLRRIREKGRMNIGEYMKIIEKDGDCTFEKKDFEEITSFMLGQLEEALIPMHHIFKSWLEGENHFCIDRNAYYKDSMDPNFGQNIISLLSDPKLIGLKNSLYHFFTCILNSQYISDFTCTKEELNDVFATYANRFTTSLALAGDVTAFEEIKKSAYRNYDHFGYDKLKQISIMRGDVPTTFFLGEKRNPLTSQDLQALSINKAREEKKEEIINEIKNIIYKINDKAGQKMFNAKEYYTDKENTIGKKLMNLSIEEIQAEHTKFENILSDLKQVELKKKHEGVATVLAALLNKPEPPKAEKKSKKKTTTN